jgi:hypothetical protein
MAWFNIFEKKAPERKPSDRPASPFAWFSSSVPRPLVSYENAIAAENAIAHPMIGRCLHKIASSVQTVAWYCEEDPDVPAIERASKMTIRAINSMLRSPNDSFQADQLRYWMALNMAAFARVPFKISVSSIDEVPTGIFPLAVKYTKTKLDARGSVVAYQYGNGVNYETIPARSKAPRGKAYAHEIFTPNLDGDLENGKTMSILNSIGLPSKVIRLLLERAIDTASGHPNSKYIITTEKTITEKKKDQIRDQLTEGGAGGEDSGNVLFLPEVKLDVHNLDNNLSDLHSKMPLDDMSRMIAGAWGIPIALIGLGAADGAKFANNYDSSRRAFWEDTIIPVYLTPIATGMTAALCPPGARIVFDLDSISAIGDVRVAKAKELSSVDFLTDDEKRELAGFAPLTDAQRKELTERRKPVTPVANTNPTNEPDDPDA